MIQCDCTRQMVLIHYNCLQWKYHACTLYMVFSATLNAQYDINFSEMCWKYVWYSVTALAKWRSSTSAVCTLWYMLFSSTITLSLHGLYGFTAKYCLYPFRVLSVVIFLGWCISPFYAPCNRLTFICKWSMGPKGFTAKYDNWFIRRRRKIFLCYPEKV